MESRQLGARTELRETCTVRERRGGLISKPPQKRLFRVDIRQFLKFFVTSVLATLIDLCAYAALVTAELINPAGAHVLGQCSGLVVAFIAQKLFVFDQQRALGTAFGVATGLWAIGLGLGTLMIAGLTSLPFLGDYPVIPKLFVVGLMFWYNYFTRRFAFGDHLSASS